VESKCIIYNRVLKLLHQKSRESKEKNVMTVSKERTLLKDCYKYVLANIVVKVKGQRTDSEMQ
jgi:hypothetical protein